MEKVTVGINGEEKQYESGTTYKELTDEYQSQYKDDIVLVQVDERLKELSQKVKDAKELKFITSMDKAGRKAYRRSMTLMMQKAIFNLSGDDEIGVRVQHSISQGYFCRLTKGDILNEEYLAKVKAEMIRMCKEDIPIKKWNAPTEMVLDLCREWEMHDKERLFHYRRNSRVNVYEIDGYYDYYYGYMVPSTGYLKYFDLRLYEDGFVLLFPDKESKKVAEFKPSHKLFCVLDEAAHWGEMLDCGTLGAFNDAITHGRSRDIMLVHEALMEKKIGEIAEEIMENKNTKFVMIAGPSSSGKTTFSHRLSIQLIAHGIKPHPISLDDFYLDRDKCPVDENGKYDFECIEALNIELFNDVMQRLLTGEEVQMPKFNFMTGKSEKADKLQLKEDEVLVIEGIHGLNDQLSYTLPSQSKYKIYISALTQLNIDEHNSLSTTDGRLIRRIVRDARTRGVSAKQTIAMWDSVRRGEEKHIFPFQDDADVMFNSALIYELAVLKPYAEAQLFAIERDCPEYIEAKRLLKFLDYVLPLPAEGIPNNSIIREFIGGSCFPV
ncbi:nucleoside kinase [Eubacterium oxidoreducens]|uniref:Uridine kinase n=1 Tax=Eubacterium oxidoreducens TaxID=1732 RepID=A0A1G6BLS3_EUBOX|nr:nucleoside kinase [Eubacterium oxidoreducens]SDB21558.1 uridine kinase [Eubacterium oxidoreducens]